MQKQQLPIAQARLTFLGDTPYAEDFGDLYYSRQNGLAESRYVFLQHNQLKARWEKFAVSEDNTFIIGETGFGTGLNFLACWQLWQAFAPKDAKLYFLSVEKYPLSLSQLKQSLNANAACSDELEHYIAALLNNYPCPSPGLHNISFGNVQLQLFIGDVHDALQQWLPYHRDLPPENQPVSINVDAWFLDGFSPAKNPEMWTAQLFQHMIIHSKAQTSFATFSAAGAVRRGLQQAGFTVFKTKGFAGKREMLYGYVQQPTSKDSWFSKPSTSNWHCYRHKHFQDKTALVIGAGLAGCNTAYALARSGWQVYLIDKAAEIASAASGNRQSILYARLSWPTNDLTAFNLSALQYAIQHFKQLFQSGLLQAAEGALCGVLQLAYNAKEALRLQTLADAFAMHPNFCHYQDQRQASLLSNIELHCGGLYFPNAGWINPPGYCAKLTAHPNIQFIANTEIEDVQFYKQQWHALDKQRCYSAAIAVICNSAQAQQFSHCNDYPLKTIRGQVSHWPQQLQSSPLKVVLCHQGYIAPAFHQRHDVGATFNLHNRQSAISLQDHLENWRTLQEHLPELAHALVPDSQSLSTDHPAISNLHGRTGFRASSTDYLPIVGQVANKEKLLAQFAVLRQRARRIINAEDIGMAGLFINIAHGSRGLSSAPFAAAHIASLVNNSPSNMSQDMQLSVHPARFLIRALKRKSI